MMRETSGVYGDLRWVLSFTHFLAMLLFPSGMEVRALIPEWFETDQALPGSKVPGDRAEEHVMGPVTSGQSKRIKGSVSSLSIRYKETYLMLAEQGNNQRDGGPLNNGLAPSQLFLPLIHKNFNPALYAVVPSVINQTRNDAETAIVAAQLTVGIVTQDSSPTIPSGKVKSQNPAAGLYVAKGTAVDLVVSLGPATVNVPDVVNRPQAEAESLITAAGLRLGTISTENSETVEAGLVISQNPGAGTSVPQDSSVNLVVSLGSTLPPDPTTTAPPFDTTVATSLFQGTAFLYTGATPIQTGVATGTIDPQRVAVIRGKVLTREGHPLPEVLISIFDHPEFGQTKSRADGMFDLAVNGGGYLTVHYAKAGYLPAQRRLSLPWQDFVWTPEVVLIVLDPQSTAIDLGSTLPMQVAQGSVTADERGTRQSTLFFPQGTQAEIVLPDGAKQPLSNLTVRATEYTVGPNGPQAMPGMLPPGVEYTYAVELSVDEALNAGATTVQFSQPVIQYVENFLAFPTGARVPSYYYDRQRGIWVPSEDGRVIKILGVSGGLANLDIDGDDQADDLTSLGALGITEAERERLAVLYPVGMSLWRVRVTHFTPTDLNWPPPPNPPLPPSPDVAMDQPQADDCTSTGSIIECRNQVLGESIPISGTPFTLNYRSDRVPGRQGVYALSIPISGNTVHSKVVSIELEIHVAGRKITRNFSRDPGQTYTFTWDGLDAYGRKVQGEVPVTVRLGYTYRLCYWVCRWNDVQNEWNCGESCPNPPVDYGVAWSQWKGSLGLISQKDWGIGGWSLNSHHFYNPDAGVLHLGNGDWTAARDIGNVVRTVAGGKPFNNAQLLDLEPGSAAMLPATQRAIFNPKVAVGPDGSFYISDALFEEYGFDYNFPISRIIKVFPDGRSIVLAGRKDACTLYGREVACYPHGYSGDGGPADQASLFYPRGVALAPDGSLYIAEWYNRRVRRIGTDGIITTVAGGGPGPLIGDGGPATQALLDCPYGVVFAPDGSLYVSDACAPHNGDRIRRVDPNGIITTVAGNGTRGFSGDGGPATQAQLDSPHDLALGPDGSLYIMDEGNHRVRKVGTDGIITTVAGSGSINCNAADVGDGGLATEAMVGSGAIAVGQDGSLYINDGYCTSRLRKVNPAGIITTINNGGTGGAITYGEGVPLEQADIGRLDVALSPAGALYFAGRSGVQKVGAPLPGFSGGNILIPSRKGREVYLFAGNGKHLQTIDSRTSGVLYEFGYDTSGRLITIQDGNGKVTTIERDSSGQATAIAGPYGQRTALALDSNGYLTGITNPAGEKTSCQYTGEGLLTSMITPRGYVYDYSYDASGRLIRNDNPAGGYQTLTKTDFAGGFEVTRTTALGRSTTYRGEKFSTGEFQRTIIFPDGTQATALQQGDGSQTATRADGTVTSLDFGPDPRFGMQSPILKTLSIQTPGGLEYTLGFNRYAILATPGDPLSLTSLTDELRVNNRLYQSQYQSATRQTTLTTPSGRQSITTLDGLGRVVKQEQTGLAPFSLVYDGTGKLTTITQGMPGNLRTLTLDYNGGGYISGVTDPQGRTVTFAYDPAGRVTRQVLPGGREVHYSYDANGNVTSITPPGRPVHAFSYSAMDRMGEYLPPPAGAGTGATTYTYNSDRQLTQVTRPDGKAVALTYDSGGKVSSQTIQRGTTSYAYDALTGNITTITAPDGGILSHTYDGSLVTGVTWQGAVQGNLGFTYDDYFQVVSRTVNGGDAVDFLYDNEGLLIQTGALTINRNPQNGLISGTTLGLVADTRSYNAFGELSFYTASVNASDIFQTLYTRDSLGRILEKTETISGIPKNYAYRYDNAGRLAEVKEGGNTLAAYAYDANGNRTTTDTGTPVNATFDDQDRLVHYGSTTYAYTGNGDLAGKTVGGLTTTYQYDELGNLVAVSLPDGNALTYIIDGRNRRIGKRVNNVLIQGFLFENRLNPAAEVDAVGTVLSRFIYGTKSNVPDYLVKGGLTYRIISDHLGSVRLVVDVASGGIAQRLDYDAFGKVITDTNPGFQPFGFAGGLYDRDTKLTRFGVRDYDAETGRWTTKDPIGFAGRDTNLYQYVLSDPVNWRDPSGLLSWGDVTSALSELAGKVKSLWDDLSGKMETAEAIAETATEFNEISWNDPKPEEGAKGLACLFKNFGNLLPDLPVAKFLGSIGEMAGETLELGVNYIEIGNKNWTPNPAEIDYQ
jgi:RHS repeat-associated protein